MKKLVMFLSFAAMGLITGLSSCSKDNVAQPNTQASATSGRSDLKKCDNNNHNNNCGGGSQNCGTAPTSTCGSATVVNLVNSQNHVVGTVTISNNATDLYVTYAVDSGWHFSDLHLYVGDTTHVPYNGCGRGPNCNQFQYSSNTCTTCSAYTFTIPVSSLTGTCFIVAAQADVTCTSGSNCGGSFGGFSCGGGFGGFGGSCGQQQCSQPQCCWGGGCSFGGRCSGPGCTYTNYCLQSCVPVVTCISGPGQLFSGSAWPNGVTSITVGGFTYTPTTASAVLNESPNNNDAQSGFLAVATLKVYGSSISPTAAVLSASTIVENWLATVGQLNASSNFTAPANVEAAISTVATWEASNQCQTG